MRWQYSYLNETPYLYPSKELRNMYRGSSGKKETNAIVADMERHEVFDNRDITVYQAILWMICMRMKTKCWSGEMSLMSINQL
ncbi:hypothetical protein IKQ_01833 [Bacillus cereus VDM053]|nr:hypothetical protein IC7_01612 [Bacillus cereus BAG1O-1]EOP55618.1 hypothetical protein IKQ_01833 [Bacillus cereus VDM053]